MAFTRYMFRARRGFDWIDAPHHQAIVDRLHKVATGQIKRLIINIPPRYSKTELAVVNFVAWSLGIWPDSEFIHASYSKRLATLNSWQIKDIVSSQAYQNIFQVPLRDDSKAKDEWRTQAGGCVYATGAGGTITGYGAGKARPGFGGAVIIDDPHKAAEATSPVMRANVIDWYRTTIESRLNTVDTPIIVIMQRLHEEDLSGWLLAGGNGETWDHLCIPAIDEHDQPLWPHKHSREELRRMETADPYTFAGQYMQHPVPAEGGIIKRAWVKRYTVLPDNPTRIVQSWDTAYKPGQLNDPSVCTTWAETATGWYLLDVWRGRLEYPALKTTVQSLAAKHNPSAILVEDKASGQSLLQDLQTATRLPVIAIKPEGDKLTRMSAQSSQFEAGRVYLPEFAEWLPEYEAEMFLFPASKHDDQIDSTSQFLRWATANQYQYEYTPVPLGIGSRFSRSGAW